MSRKVRNRRQSPPSAVNLAPPSLTPTADEKKTAEIGVSQDWVEEQFYAQEHRLTYLLYNFLFVARTLPEADPRRNAIRRALLWRILTPTSTAVAAGGLSLTAVLGVVLAYQANSLLQGQNQLIESQNSLIQTQNRLSESQRRSSVGYELTSILDELNAFNAEYDNTRSSDIYAINKELREAEQSKSFDKDKYLSLKRKKQALVETPVTLPQRLVHRCVSFCNSAFPYHIMTADGQLVGPVSPERTSLLLALVQFPVDMYDVYRSADFSHCVLENTSLFRADFRGAKLRNAVLTNVTFTECYLKYMDIRDARLKDVAVMSIHSNPMDGVFLPEANNIDEVTAKWLDPEGAFVENRNWLNELNLPEDADWRKSEYELKLTVLHEEYKDTPMAKVFLPGDQIALEAAWQIRRRSDAPPKARRLMMNR